MAFFFSFFFSSFCCARLLRVFLSGAKAVAACLGLFVVFMFSLLAVERAGQGDVMLGTPCIGLRDEVIMTVVTISGDGTGRARYII